MLYHKHLIKDFGSCDRFCSPSGTTVPSDPHLASFSSHHSTTLFQRAVKVFQAFKVAYVQLPPAAQIADTPLKSADNTELMGIRRAVLLLFCYEAKSSVFYFLCVREETAGL